jgi:hypothetical protein
LDVGGGGGIFRSPRAGIATRVYGGLESVYLLGAKKVGDAGEVPQPHAPFMAHARR